MGCIRLLGGTKAINGLWPAASDDTVGLDAFLVDQSISDVLVVTTGPTKLAANVPEWHPEVAILLRPFGEHVDHLLAPQRKLGLVGMGVAM